MKRFPAFTAAAAIAICLSQAGCTQTTERDGRAYHGNASPLQGKMGVTFRRVPVDEPAPDAAPAAAEPAPAADSEGLLGRLVSTEGPPGLLDRYTEVDEPGAEYWMHAEQSPSPLQGKMGVRVSRRKK